MELRDRLELYAHHAPRRGEVTGPDRTEALRDTLRVHHPIMRSETGPLSGCRCGEVRLGQDVIAHVVDRLDAALAPTGPEPRTDAAVGR